MIRSNEFDQAVTFLIKNYEIKNERNNINNLQNVYAESKSLFTEILRSLFNRHLFLTVFLSNSEFSKQAYNFTDHRESVFDLMFYLSSTKTHSIQTKLPLQAYCVETRSQYHHRHKLSTSDPKLFLYFIPNVRTPTVAFLNIPHAHICAKDQLLLYIEHSVQ